MKKPDDITRLQHIFDSALKAVRFAQGRSRGELDTDEMLALAIMRLLEIIGEASREVSDKLRSNYPEVPWQKMASMRNRLIHAYFEVNQDLVWETVTTDLPPLIAQLQEVLAKEGKQSK